MEFNGFFAFFDENSLMERQIWSKCRKQSLNFVDIYK